MALEIIKRGQRVMHEEFALRFDKVGHPGSGYSFPCDINGNFIEEQDNPHRKENFERVKNDPNYTFWGVQIYKHSYYEPGEGKCKCGRTVYLEPDYGHGIDCDCGRIYNMSGQELAPRSQWDDRYDDDDSVGYNVRFGYVGEDY